MDGWMDGWRLIDNRQMDEPMYGWTHGWVDVQISEQTNEWMNGWMDGWMDGWIEGWRPLAVSYPCDWNCFLGARFFQSTLVFLVTPAAEVTR